MAEKGEVVRIDTSDIGKFKADLKALSADELKAYNMDKLRGLYSDAGALGNSSLAVMGEWKNRIKSGEINMREFIDSENVQGIASDTMDIYNSITHRPEWAAIATKGMKELNKYVTADTSKGGSTYEGLKVPLTNSEFSVLGKDHPDMLPTREELDSLQFDPELLPPNAKDLIDKYRPSGGTDGTDGEGDDSFTATTTIPGKVEDERIVGDVADRFEQQSRDLLGQQEARREASLKDLSGLMTGRRDEMFKEAVPGLAEQAQEGGFLTSTGFGDSLAKKLASLEREQSYVLGVKGIEYGDMSTQALGNILQQRQGLETAGVERRFSLADWERQSDLAREIGASTVPDIRVPEQGGGVLAGALAGGTAGAAIPGAPWAAIPGAIIGGYAGSEGAT